MAIEVVLQLSLFLMTAGSSNENYIRHWIKDISEQEKKM